MHKRVKTSTIRRFEGNGVHGPDAYYHWKCIVNPHVGYTWRNWGWRRMDLY